MTAVPQSGPQLRPTGRRRASPVMHMAGSAVVGLVVGAIAAAAVRHAHDPAASDGSVDVSGPESVVMVLAGGLVVGPVAAAMFRSVRLLVAAALAAAVGGPALAVLFAVTLRGDAAGGVDRFLAWTLAVTTVYTLAGAVTAPRVRPGNVLVAALALGLATSAAAAAELRWQDRWRTWDVAHHGVALVLPDLSGFEPTGMRFYSAGIHVRLTGGDGTVLVDLLDRAASRVRVCDSGTCWARAGDRWSSGSVVTRRHGDRLIQISAGDGARVDVPVDVALRPVTAQRLARLPVLPTEYAD